MQSDKQTCFCQHLSSSLLWDSVDGWWWLGEVSVFVHVASPIFFVCLFLVFCFFLNQGICLLVRDARQSCQRGALLKYFFPLAHSAVASRRGGRHHCERGDPETFQTHTISQTAARGLSESLWKSNNPARQHRQTRRETEWNEQAQTVQLSRQTHRCSWKSSCFVSLCSRQISQLRGGLSTASYGV